MVSLPGQARHGVLASSKDPGLYQRLKLLSKFTDMDHLVSVSVVDLPSLLKNNKTTYALGVSQNLSQHKRH